MTEEKKDNLNHYERFIAAKKAWRKKRGKRKKQWCPGCGYSYRGAHCTRCGGE